MGTPIFDFDVWEKEFADWTPEKKCSHCGEGTAFWADDYEPLYTLKCKNCLSHTEPCLERERARCLWIKGTLFKIGTYREGGC